MTIYYGRKDYTYNGGDKFFTITFPYIKKEHIEVFINEVKTTNYTYLTDNQISVSDALIANDVVSIRRITPINDRMVKFTNTSILNKDNQNLAQEQMFYAVQENTDNNEKFVALTEEFAENLILVDEKIVEIQNMVTLAEAATGAIPNTTGNAGKYLKQKATENGLEYGDLKTDLGIPAPTASSFLKQNSTNTGFEYKSNNQVKEDLDPLVQQLGNITSNPTFIADTPHTGFIKANIAPVLPSTTANKLKNILFDFNIEAGRTFTSPNNVKWDYNLTPTFVAYPDLSLNIATISNMALSFPATSGQYVDFNNVPFNNIGSQTWEQIWNITPTQVGVLQYLISNNLLNFSMPVIGISAANKLQLFLSSNNTAFDIAAGTGAALGTYTVVNATQLYLKLEFTGTQYKLSTSPDGVAWTTDITVVSSTPIYSTSSALLRLGQSVATPTVNTFKGTVDLTKSSIKIANGRNLLIPEVGVFLNRIIYDTMDGGTHYKAHYSQVGV